MLYSIKYKDEHGQIYQTLSRPELKEAVREGLDLTIEATVKQWNYLTPGQGDEILQELRAELQEDGGIEELNIEPYSYGVITDQIETIVSKINELITYINNMSEKR